MADKNIAAALKLIKDKDVKYVDLRFTDPRGKMQHITLDISQMNETAQWQEGVMFDGASNAGWKAIHESDMVLIPDASSIHLDPFYAQTTAGVFCDVIEPDTGKSYSRDPRSIAKRTEAYLKTLKIGDTVNVGPEAEFFVFDDVKWSTSTYKVGFELDGVELPKNSDRDYEGGNMGHRIRNKVGCYPSNPQDSAQDMRSEMLSVMAEMGLIVEKHHHEGASGQHELSTRYQPLVKAADQMQLHKYVVHNVANSYGKTATFMPKPVYGDHGSGLHCHFSISKDGKTQMVGKEYAGLSEIAMFFLGGILKHARALNAFTNPSTNSYKRLVPGYEAPVLLAYSQRNRSASCRIPLAQDSKAKRVEVRFPDPSANPYLAFSAIVMAGLDGIMNKTHPGKAMDKDLYHLPPAELAKIPTVCGSLQEAIDSLMADHAFLLKGDVFSKDQIESYLALKQEEQDRYRMTPHPVEFDMYYSC